ncbi:hypothetical protein [Brachyspira alvinipulli]|uniref:hypothetical protein n=1 Tax=Brachyspira alvinipulli TaxID=84379 RepID=UPI000482A3CC|nr:hypothetical protein [Brachyspira alvinipulli]
MKYFENKEGNIFFIRDEYNPKLWLGGEVKTIKNYDTNKCNVWIVYTPTEAEEMIRKYNYTVSCKK